PPMTKERHVGVQHLSVFPSSLVGHWGHSTFHSRWGIRHYYFFRLLHHSVSNSTPAVSTRLVESGGICPVFGPRLPIRYSSTLRAGSPDAINCASFMSNVWCTGLVSISRILSHAVPKSSCICALPPPAST